MSKTQYTGTFEEGCPGNAGIVNCKCEIYANKPIFKRRQQDQDFILSPETINALPEIFQNKLSFIYGVDGVFLREVYNYRSNYAAFRKKNTEFIDKETGLRVDDLFTEWLPLRYLEFLNLPILFNRQYTQVENQESPHQTWIMDGSLFCSDTATPSERFVCRKKADGTVDKEAEFRRQYLAAWTYRIFTAPPTVAVIDGAIRSDGTDRFAPYQIMNAKESPATAILNVSGESGDLLSIFKIGDQFRNINPGIHWSSIKRTPVFQGEDFWVEFLCGTDEPNIVDHGESIFAMQDKYRFLDVHTVATDSNGVIINGGVIELDEDGKVDDKSKGLYDLARQSYFIIEIGVDHPDHNYFILIPEKDYPVFIHAGEFITVAPVPAESSEESSSKKPPVFVPKRALRKISRSLSSWRVASGKVLMERKEPLRVTVRNHMGSIVITFSGFENDPWVIDRYDLVEKEGIASTDEITQDNVQTTVVPMVVPRGKIAIHGGNRQSSFAFAPLQYYNINAFKFPQNLSLLGPIEQEDINILLRDKGVSKNPSISSQKREYDFTMDAEIFSEIVEGFPENTYAMDAQPEAVISYGKAPDAQGIRDSRRTPSTIKVSNGESLIDVGSSGPYVKQTQVSLDFIPGDYIFPNPDDKEIEWHLQSCITPIATHFRLYVPPTGTAYTATPIDVSHHVMNFSDSWSARDFNLIEHTGSIKFLINEGMEPVGQVNYAPFLSSLVDKTFYLQVSVWWEDGVMPKPDLERDRIMITGLCTGGSITVENGKKIMSCEIFDYYRILKDQMFLNSPFFDKMRDFNAVYEVLKMAGFRDVGDYDPASLLKRLAETDESDWFYIVHNGEGFLVNDYALPGSYDIIQNPFMRFNDGEKYSDAIEKMSAISGKVAYFDQLGVFHFENLPFEQMFFNSEGVDYQTPVEEYAYLSKIDFFVSPREEDTQDFHRQVFNSYTLKRNVEDVVNEIRVISTTPNGELLLAGHTNFDSLFRHNTPGFIGYPKQFLQMEGAFGSESAVKYIVKHYTKMFTPPVTLNFEAFGHNKLKALDIVRFKQLHSEEYQPLIVQSISSEVDPSKNSWLQNFECQWIFPSLDINWGPSTISTPPFPAP